MKIGINIAAILKDKPKGTKLYSSACGECELKEADDKNFKISFYSSKSGFMNGGEGTFDKNGKLYDGGECIVFPSKVMRDWSKFAWKRGDILVSNDGGTEIIFDKWYNDTYTGFYGKHYLNSEIKCNIKYNECFLCTTDRYSIEKNNAAQLYINAIENRLGGKLNRETLKIEKVQPEFKDGDILSIREDKEHYHTIFILKEGTDVYVFFDYFHRVLTYSTKIDENEKSICHLATEDEKRVLLNALAKEGKAWDSEKKQIVELKPKWIPKPFDKVVTRNSADDIWTANIFSHIDSRGEYVTIACVGGYTYCLPYNEETAKLIGTAKEWKE